jgi:uncharacterized repeat protein (TIGR01451 family)
MRKFIQSAGFRAMTLLRTAALMLILLSNAALFPAAAMASPVPGGTIIRSIANATYFNTALGMVETVQSNRVEAIVMSVPGLSVAGYSALLMTRGSIAQYYFDVVNSGNVTLNALMHVEDQLGASMMGGGQLVADLNGNGIIDGNERSINLALPMKLLPGQRLQLIYEFRVSTNTVLGDAMRSALIVTATVDGDPNATAPVQGTAQGITTIVSGALTITKSQVVRDNDRITQLDYTLRVRNNSEQAVPKYDNIDGAPLRIDGTQRAGILVRDVMPLNTVFAGIADAGGMEALYHHAGDPQHDYLTQQPAAAADIDAVAFFMADDYDIGQSRDPSFTVNVPKPLGDVEVANTATTYLEEDGQSLTLSSNTTFYDRTGSGAGALRFEYPDTATDQIYGTAGSDTRLRVTSGSCNLSGDADLVTITVRSALTGDIENLTATETGPNTGVFLTAALPLARMDPSRAGDGVMATTPGDTLFATAECGGVLLDDELLIDPGNFLFNSVTNDAIEGVEIVLVNAATGATVLRSNTDERGFFSLGQIAAGRYRYEVLNAPAWIFPSVRMDFTGFRKTVTSAGFGNLFTHAGGMVHVSDIPVDPFYGAPLSLDKDANTDTVTQGEFVTYSLGFTNNMHQALIGAELLDRPARGVTLVPGSVLLNGTALPDPVDAQGGDLLFDLGTLEPLSNHELTYVMRFTAAAVEGRNENTAVLSGRQAGTGTLRQSPVARAMVRLNNSGGVFAREGTVIGSVFMDCDGDGIRGDITEPGIPGVRIVTQEGLSVVTDIDGKYSLFGLRPVTHAFLVQDETLPIGTAVTVTRTNDLMRGGSRLIPLRKGELRAEHFAVADCTPEAMVEVAKRRTHFDEAAGINTLTASDLPITSQGAPVRSSRGEQGIATTTQLTTGMLDAEQEAREDVATKAEAIARREPLDAMIRTLNSEPGFIDLQDGQTVDRSTQNIRVKGKADLTLALALNGRPLGADRVGQRTSWEANNVQAAEFIAVKLDPGKNTLALIGKDGFGIERVRTEITLIAPGAPAKFEIIMPETASASPVSIVPVVVRVLDARGMPVPASGTVTLDARMALWDVTDIRPGTPGVQAYLDNGEATFGLIPPQVSGTDRITVTGNFGTAEATIAFTPNLDERILIGVIEGAVSLGGNDVALLPKDRFSSFEDTATGLRGEVYLKGAIRGDALLTLRYSSDRDTEDRLFRDIRGDEYYPVYGDNSERGQDAQSSSNLFVKVEKGRSYILYGDIAIEPESSALRLDGMRRVTTGAKAHWENDKVSVTVFGARTAQQQRVQEIRGRGVSGPYDIDLGDYVQGSERVEILVRDERGGDILTTTAMRRGTDYVLDFFRDTLTFNAPVRQFDLDGNPVSIRITYETSEAGAERYWLYGGEVNYAVSDQITVGARAVHADAPAGNPADERIQSGYIRHEGENGGVFEAELARSENARGQVDNAARLSYDLQTEFHRLSFEAIHTGKNFNASGGLARPGTTQVRLSYGYDIDKNNDLVIGADFVRDRINDLDRLTLEAIYSRQINKRLRGDIGLEYRHDQNGATTEAGTAIILGAHWTPLGRDNTVIEAELRQPLNIGGDQPTELTLGLYREAAPGWRVFNEVELQFGDDLVMPRSTLGFTFQMNKWLSGRTEFSRGANETDTTLNQGLSAQFKLNSLTTLNMGIEHSRLLDAEEAKMTSLAIGAKWGSDETDWVGDADFDTTFEKSGTTYYGNLGLAGQITPDLTVLGRTRIAVDNRNGQNRQRVRTRVGAAYRPLTDPRLEVLAWYEHRLEKLHNTTKSHLWSVDASYEVDADLRVNGKYAGQHQSIELTNTSATSLTQLVQAGANYEFGGDRFQIGVNGAYLWDDTNSATWGLGAEFGFVPAKGTLLALGYNLTGSQLPQQDALYQKGLHLRFDLLLDNSLWDQLDGFLGD